MRVSSMTIWRGIVGLFGPGVAAALALLALTAMGPVTAQAASNPGPSFDCTRARGADERTICVNPYLSRIDVLVAKAYANFVPQFGGSKRAIGKWLLDDRYACGTDEACIAAVQVNALETYGGSSSWAESYVDALIGAKAAAIAASMPQRRHRVLPQSVGDCAVTRITRITTRFGGPLQGADPNTGAAVGYANRGWGVSYDPIDALYGARIGDPVVMCLISIPRDCPRGDVRGRVYYSLDARTGGTWSLPDSQHSCGGA